MTDSYISESNFYKEEFKSWPKKRQLCTRCVSEQVSKSSGDPGPCLYTGQKYKRSLSPIMRGVDDRILLSMCDRDTCRPTSCNKYEYY